MVPGGCFSHSSASVRRGLDAWSIGQRQSKANDLLAIMRPTDSFRLGLGDRLRASVKLYIGYYAGKHINENGLTPGLHCRSPE